MLYFCTLHATVMVAIAALHFFDFHTKEHEHCHALFCTLHATVLVATAALHFCGCHTKEHRRRHVPFSALMKFPLMQTRSSERKYATLEKPIFTEP